MADAAKYHLVSNDGSTIAFSDLKSHGFLFTARKSKVLVYGILFIFVAFTVFLAFSPPSSSSAHHNTSTDTSSSSPSSVYSEETYRSHLPSIFSYFFPNSSSPALPVSSDPRTSAALPLPTSSSSPSGPQAGILKPNHTTPQPSDAPIPANVTGSSAPVKGTVVKAISASLSKKPTDGNPVSTTTTLNKTASLFPTPMRNTSSPSPLKNTASPPPASSTKTATRSSPPASDVKATGNGPAAGEKGSMKSLADCDLYDGEWVRDDSYPLYKPGSCGLIDEQFNCLANGRADSDFQKLRWKPKGCTLPRLNASHALELLRGQRLVFAGDSLNRNMWESLICILRNSVKDKSHVYEASGRQHFRTEASYSFVFKDYNCNVEFFASPFLVRQWEVKDNDGKKKETLRLDLIGESFDQFKNADIVLFNTGHWWTHEKTAQGKDYYQEGNHVYEDLKVTEAFRRAMTTWARWVDANINPSKTFVLFRGYSNTHFSGGQWNSGGQCDSETLPIKNKAYLSGYPWKMKVFESVIKGMKTPVSYLNITLMTDYRKDGHPSIYRKKNLSDEERRSQLMIQDCSHWCLPGVPDSWNELFYAELLRKHYGSQRQKGNRT